MNEFEKLKNMIISTINACKSQEITQYTKYFESGIYLLYVDNLKGG